jgi:hypothetical protein
MMMTWEAGREGERVRVKNHACPVRGGGGEHKDIDAVSTLARSQAGWSRGEKKNEREERRKTTRRHRPIPPRFH